MELAALKPLLTSLVMPPLSLLVLAMLGIGLAWRLKRAGLVLAFCSLALLWLISCHGMAVWLARTILPQVAPLPVAQAAQLGASGVQAIVVLGGGVLPMAPEYGVAQLSANSTIRLRYGLWLSRQSGLPVALSGGMGWTANVAQKESEADVARRTAQQEYGMTLRWTESSSRDTVGNARLTATLLKRDGIRHITLVTEAWHLPRAIRAFEREGLQVTPAPTAFMLPTQNRLIEWLPSGPGLQGSQQVLREALALLVGRFLPV